MYNFSRVSYGRTSIKKQVAMQDSMVTNLYEENEQLKARIEELELKLQDTIDDMQDDIDEAKEEARCWEEYYVNEEENHCVTMSDLEAARDEIALLEYELKDYRLIEEKTGLSPDQAADMLGNLQSNLSSIKCPNCS